MKSEIIPDFLTEYVKCITGLNPYGWTSHTNERVFYASILSLYYARFDRLRHFSTQIAERYSISYRRLEYYAEDIGAVDTGAEDGYGKLIQVVFYASQDTPETKSFTIEGRVFVPAPLFLSADVIGSHDEFISLLESILDDVMVSLGFPPFTAMTDPKIEGIFEDMSGVETWCNDVTKVSLRETITVELTKTEEYGARVSRYYTYDTRTTIYDAYGKSRPIYRMFLRAHGIEDLEIL